MKYALPTLGFLLAFFACTPEAYGWGEPDTYTAQGFRVYIDTTDDVFVMSLSHGADVHGELFAEITATDFEWYSVGDDIRLKLTDECGGVLEGCKYAGITYTMPDLFPMTVLWSAEYGTACAGTSAYAHELTHVALFLEFGDPDGAHLEEWAWNGPGSVTQRAMMESQQEYPCVQ